MTPPEIAATREAQALVATYKAHEARQDSADPLALMWSAKQIAPLLTALAAALERVTAERDEARAWRDLAEKSRAWFENALEAAEAERERLRVYILYTPCHVCGLPDPTRYAADCEQCAKARAALAGGTDAAPPEQKP